VGDEELPLVEVSLSFETGGEANKEIIRGVQDGVFNPAF
jgi:hypothetical protein